MARPLKIGLSYFPLPTDVFHDPVAKALRRSYGTVGVLTYLNIMCRVYGDGGYYHRFTDLDTLCADIAEDITNNHFSRVAAAVRESISTLIDHEFLDKAFFEKGLITGTEIQEQYVIAAAKTKRRIDLGVCQLVDPTLVALKNRINSEKTNINSEETPINSEETPQSKGKVKEKENSTLYSVYGTHHNVRLTDAQYKDIKEKIPDADSYIDHFSERLKAKEYTIKDHHGAILEWWEIDKEKPKRRQEAKPQGSFDTDDFFQAALNKGFRTHRDD